MEIIYQLIGGIANVFMIFSKNVTEEVIEKNIEHLKQYDWFTRFLENESFQKLISKDQDVRYIIGKLNQKKLQKNPNKYEQKIYQALEKARN
ncbi:hypothetical protein [Sutcliffiella halmapala]|uniref:hypothetical protein n=1 Tax=Sutcliffiella halmapala TaxID=79882 RepID=UPI0009957104|nr:hypothetical protein [Sutcliffiella halmapala]